MLHPVDIITRNNQETGRISSLEEANNKGLWHRGAHAALYTKDHKFLVQRRDPKMVHYPGLLDIGVGGYVDSGETAEQAIIREIYEETGIVVTVDDIQLIGITKENRAWNYGKRRKILRIALYSYVCHLDKDSDSYLLEPQVGEVVWVGFLALRSVRWLIRKHFLRHFGYLSPTYGYYRKLINAAVFAMKHE
jgi:8-oxo-dGTP pyrophosphatase MutT (NUDIX family)